MRALYFHNSFSVRKILFLWLTLCFLPGVSQANGSLFNETSYDNSQQNDTYEFNCDNTLTIALVVEGKKQVGVVKVTFDEYNLTVKFIANDGWLIEKTQLAVADSFSGLPQDRYGNPKLRRFPFKTTHKQPVQVVNQILSTAQWPLGTELYIAAHADVVALKSRHTGKKHFSADSWSGKWQESIKLADKTRNGDHDSYKSREQKKDKQSEHDYVQHFSKKLIGSYSGNDGQHKTKSCRSTDKEHDRKAKRSKTKSTWPKGLPFPGNNNGFYFTYTLNTCKTPADTTIEFSTPVYHTSEDESSALVTVTRSGADLSTPAIVRIVSSDGTAVAGIDYGMIDQQLVFLPNVTQMDVSIPVIDDSDAEETETVNLQLLDIQGASLGDQDTAVLEISDNEPASYVFEPANYSVTEPDRGATVDVTVSVKRLGSLNDFGSVDVVIIGGTANNRDYFFMPTTLEFPAGETTSTQPVTITIVGDNTGESDETVLFGFGGAVNGQIGEPSQAELMIIDNDGN